LPSAFSTGSSLARVRRAIFLAVLLALALAGCGDSGRSLLTQRQADGLTSQLDKVENAFASDPPKCSTARRAAQSGARRARALSQRVDSELRQNLVDWFEHLDDEARQECIARQEPEETPTTSPTPTETPDETPTPDKTPTPDATESPTPTPTPTATATATAEPTGGTGVDGEE
jgi:DNA primase